MLGVLFAIEVSLIPCHSMGRVRKYTYVYFPNIHISIFISVLYQHLFKMYLY